MATAGQHQQEAFLCFCSSLAACPSGLKLLLPHFSGQSSGNPVRVQLRGDASCSPVPWPGALLSFPGQTSVATVHSEWGVMGGGPWISSWRQGSGSRTGNGCGVWSSRLPRWSDRCTLSKKFGMLEGVRGESIASCGAQSCWWQQR